MDALYQVLLWRYKSYNSVTDTKQIFLTEIYELYWAYITNTNIWSTYFQSDINIFLFQLDFNKKVPLLKTIYNGWIWTQTLRLWFSNTL